MIAAPGAHSHHGWLVLALPTAAVRYRVDDPEVAYTLSHADAQLVEAGAEVSVTESAVGGDAPTAVVAISRIRRLRGPRIMRLLARLLDALPVVLRVAATRRQMRRLGFPRTDAFLWDVEERVPLAGERPRLRLPRRFPRAGVVVGRRDPSERILFVSAADDAAAALGCDPSAFRSPIVTASGLVMAFSSTAVLRVAVGPAAAHIDAQRAALEVLRDASLSAGFVKRMPWPLAAGHSGLAAWTLETRLPGAVPPTIDASLLTECVDVLVELFGSVRSSQASDHRHAALADKIGFWRPTASADLERLGEQLDALLADVPRGFAHGDFWRENLLVVDGRLAAVIDWVRAGLGRPPLVDLLHLRTAERDFRGIPWGRTLREELLPWARGGGDETANAYCRRVEVEPTPQLLEGLVLSYWLERLAVELESYRDHEHRRGWPDENLDRVLAAVARNGRRR